MLAEILVSLTAVTSQARAPFQNANPNPFTRASLKQGLFSLKAGADVTLSIEATWQTRINHKIKIFN